MNKFFFRCSKGPYDGKELYASTDTFTPPHFDGHYELVSAPGGYLWIWKHS